MGSPVSSRAEVGSYRSPDFDVMGALASNIRSAPAVLDRLQSKACRGVVLTGSLFEAGEGAGSDGVPAVSPYGLSKWLTSESFRYFVAQTSVPMGKFVIPNPFGPYEERRFTAYLMERWFKDETPTVRTPEYVRDNIHVSLLAKAYVRFSERLAGSGERFLKLNPSGYVEARRVPRTALARKVRARTGSGAKLDVAQQREFPEPRVRVNTDRLDSSELRWNERLAWDELTSYYSERLG